jgi:pyruvate carboxylase
MPGVVSTVAVALGQKVKTGDLLLVIEAMKMESAVRAELAGMIERVEVRPGDQISPRDLLVVLKPE